MRLKGNMVWPEYNGALLLKQKQNGENGINMLFTDHTIIFTGGPKS